MGQPRGSLVEIRKIQVTGGSTHIVSLPKKWVDRNHLGRSDTVAIHEESDGSLLLVPHHQASQPLRSITVGLPEDPRPEDIVRRLVGAYLAGADEIHVHAATRLGPEIRETVRNITRELVGVEILEETSESMTLQDLVGVSDMDLRKTLTRMHRIARIMFDDAIRAMQGHDQRLASDVADRDDEVDRLLWMVSKQMHALLEQPRLAARLNVAPAGALNYYLVARTVERMADHATKISKNLAAIAQAANVDAQVASIVAQSEVVGKVWDDAFNALKGSDFQQGSDVSDVGKAASQWRASFANELLDLSPEIVSALTLIADSLDRVRGYAIDIAEVAMNHTFLDASGRGEKK